MAVIAIIYGSETGNTEKVSQSIKSKLDSKFGETVADVFNVTDVTPETFAEYSMFILGASTWNIGDIQANWENFLPEMDKIDLNNKIAAVFGLGDQSGYADNFVDGMGVIAKKINERNCTIVGNWPTQGYEFNKSIATIDDENFFGLAVDEDQQADQTEERVSQWTEKLIKEMCLEEVFS